MAFLLLLENLSPVERACSSGGLDGLEHLLAEGVQVRPALVNGRPCAVTTLAGRVYSTLSVEFHAGRISGIYIVVNPDKLARLGAG